MKTAVYPTGHNGLWAKSYNPQGGRNGPTMRHDNQTINSTDNAMSMIPRNGKDSSIPTQAADEITHQV